MGYVQIKLPPELHKDLKTIALQQDKTLRQVITEILGNHVKRKKK